MKLQLLFMALPVILTACATPLASNQASGEFRSDPEGATISMKGNVWGEAPQGRLWTFTGGNRSHSIAVTATWPNGVSVTNTVNINVGDDKVFTLRMPQGAAEKKRCSDYGFREGTTAYANCVQTEVLAAERAEREQNAAAGAAYGAAMRDVLKEPTKTNCAKIGAYIDCTTK